MFDSPLLFALILVTDLAVIPVLIGWAWWRWGGFSRWHGYHPRTIGAYTRAVRDLRK